jgi:hypothetical protein
MLTGSTHPAILTNSPWRAVSCIDLPWVTWRVARVKPEVLNLRLPTGRWDV